MKIKTNISFNLMNFALMLFIFVKVGVVKSNGIIVTIMSTIFRTNSIPTNILEYITLALFTFLVAVNIMKKKKIIMTKHIKFYGLFVIFACLSYTWSISKSNATESIVTLLALLVFLGFLSNYIDSGEKLTNVIKYVIIANVLVSLKIILLYWFSSGSAASRIQSITGIYFNTVGQVIGFSIIFCLFMYRLSKNKLYLYSVLPQFIAIILTESRKSLLIPALGFIFVLFLEGNVKVILKYVFVLCICGVCVIYAVNRISPEIYERISLKLGELIDYAKGSETDDWSINLRAKLIETGVDIFKKNSIKGIGINNFSYYAGHYTSYRIERYAHNNFIELLSCVGIIGFCLYYITYVYIFIGLIKNRKKEKRDNFSVVALSFIVIMLIMEWGIVSYSGCLYHIYILISYSLIIYQKQLLLSDGETNDY